MKSITVDLTIDVCRVGLLFRNGQCRLQFTGIDSESRETVRSNPKESNVQINQAFNFTFSPVNSDEHEIDDGDHDQHEEEDAEGRSQDCKQSRHERIHIACSSDRAKIIVT